MVSYFMEEKKMRPAQCGKTSKTLTIGCWNINSLRIRLDLLDLWIQQLSPDIILLQETKVRDCDFPKSFFDDRGYAVAFWGEKSYNGVAIASKAPFHNTQRIHLRGSIGQARYLQAETNGLRVASVYVPNGKATDHPSYQNKLDFMRHLAEHVSPYIHQPFPTILGGDWNIAPHNEDVPDPRTWEGRLLFSQKERGSLRNLTNQGWCDSVQTLKGQKNPPTWWNYQGGAWERGRGLRIDAFLLSPWGADRLEESCVLSQWRGKECPSDHAPIQIKTWVEDLT